MMNQAITRLNGAIHILYSDQGRKYQMLGNGKFLRAVENGMLFLTRGLKTFAELERTIYGYVRYYNNERIQVTKRTQPFAYRTQPLN